MLNSCLMKTRRVALFVTMLTMLALPSRGFGQGAQMVNGEVIKVDQSANKITLKHGPIPNLGMTDSAMTMVFAVQDPQMLKTVKPGDKVKFTAERVSGVITVTKIQTGPAMDRHHHSGDHRH
jgi:Cu(I)/Ag(I) efflux system protein CusF